MELKHCFDRFVCLLNFLLIVPYGIETPSFFLQHPKWPSFNRTLWNWNRMHRKNFVNVLTFNRTLWNWNKVSFTSPLITITFNRTLWNWNSLFILSIKHLQLLLIVPYGIETKQVMIFLSKYNSFNRTLWNWNVIQGLPAAK